MRELEEERDWSRCRYRITVPSPRPMERWERVSESATVVTCGDSQVKVIWSLLGEVELTHRVWTITELNFC